MLLRTEHLTKDYGDFRALDDLNLEVVPGEVVGILGPNGSGKTTALRLIMGFLRPTRGRATIAGYDCWHQSVQARAQVAYLPGELRLYENMSGRQLIRFLSDLRGQPVRADIELLARRFDIDVDRPLATLSSGMKRKVALLQVLAPQAPLVIMDEPTNALDPNMRDELLVQVREARSRGQTVLFSSHVLSEVEQVCDRVAILRQGKLVHLQRMADLHEGRFIRAVFEDQEVEPPHLEGVTVHGSRPGEMVMESTGKVADLLSWLASQRVTELRMESLGLKAIYTRYHRMEE